MTDFHFIRPYWLLALIPLAVVWWGLWRREAQIDDLDASIDRRLLEHLLVGKHKHRWFRPVHLLLGVWLVTVAALTGPSWQKEVSPFLSDEAGLMLVLKVSESMETTDVQPSRLERAKQKISDLLEIRQGGAAGLIVYSGSAHLVMPITRDERIINTMLEDLDAGVMPVDGDKISEALKLAEQMVAQSKLPGSILVIADSAAEGLTEKVSLPVQILAMQPVNSVVDAGLEQVSQILKAPLIKMTNDQVDTEQVVKRAETRHQDVSEPGQDEKWKDGGYLLLPMLALGMLLWFRKGWELA